MFASYVSPPSNIKGDVKMRMPNNALGSLEIIQT